MHNSMPLYNIVALGLDGKVLWKADITLGSVILHPSVATIM
jgi:hypothetical protein